MGASCCGLAAARAAAALPSDVCSLFAQAWALHEVLLRRLSLEERALRLPAVPAGSADGSRWREVQQGLQALLSHFHAAATALLRRAGCSAHSMACKDGTRGSLDDISSSAEGSAAASLALDASMADWLDGRLLHCTAQALWQGLPVGPLSGEEAALLTSLLQQAGAQAAAGGHAAGARWALLQPPDIACSPATLGAPAGQPTATDEEAPPGGLPAVQDNALVDAVAGVSGSSAAGFASTPPAGEDSGSGREYAADYHWHTGGSLGGKRGPGRPGFELHHLPA